MRSETSARMSAGSEVSSAAACEEFRCESTSAMVCGCSLWMNLASCCGSAFWRASKEAASVPSAFVSRSSSRLAVVRLEGAHAAVCARSRCRRVPRSRRPSAMWWNSSSTRLRLLAPKWRSICATSRLTFWTSSSLSCCSSSALDCLRPARPAAWPPCADWAASRLPSWWCSGSWRRSRSGISSPPPRIQLRRICAEISGSLVIFSRRCLARTSAFLVITGASLSEAQRLGVHLGLQRVALGELRLRSGSRHLRPARAARRGGACARRRRQGCRRAGARPALPSSCACAAAGRTTASKHHAARQAPPPIISVFLSSVNWNRQSGSRRCAGLPGAAAAWGRRRRLQQQGRLEGQGLDHQLVAALRARTR